MRGSATEWILELSRFVVFDLTSLCMAATIIIFICFVFVWRFKFGLWPRRSLFEIYIQCWSLGAALLLGLAIFVPALDTQVQDAKTFIVLLVGSTIISAYCHLIELRPQSEEILLHPAKLTDRNAILRISLIDRIPASELGRLLRGLADLYSVVQDARGVQEGSSDRARLLAYRISVGTPNVVELVGAIPVLIAVAAALVAVVKIPKSVAETAKELATARKIWIEGTLLKQTLRERPEIPQEDLDEFLQRAESAFESLDQAKEVISDIPSVRIAESESLEEPDEDR